MYLLFLGASCFFNLQGSGSSYIPTLTSYTDIESGKIILQPKFPSLAEVLVEGLCKATSIYYYNRQGRKTKLIDNYCSEVISLKKRVTEDGETQHVFVVSDVFEIILVFLSILKPLNSCKNFASCHLSVILPLF